jgi:hypothetical protein
LLTGPVPWNERSAPNDRDGMRVRIPAHPTFDNA